VVKKIWPYAIIAIVCFACGFGLSGYLSRADTKSNREARAAIARGTSDLAALRVEITRERDSCSIERRDVETERGLNSQERSNLDEERKRLEVERRAIDRAREIDSLDGSDYKRLESIFADCLGIVRENK